MKCDRDDLFSNKGTNYPEAYFYAVVVWSKQGPLPEIQCIHCGSYKFILLG